MLRRRKCEVLNCRCRLVQRARGTVDIHGPYYGTRMFNLAANPPPPPKVQSHPPAPPTRST